jgi:hypothetical protein
MGVQGVNQYLRRGYELKGLFWGRPVRPFHFAIMMATYVISAVGMLIETQSELVRNAGFTLGFVSFVGASFLLIGWIFQKYWFSEWGLLISAGAWTENAVYVALRGDTVTALTPAAAVFISLAWVIGALGAYVLERYDRFLHEEGP